VQIVAIAEERGEVLEAGEARAEPEGVLAKERLIERLRRRPDEEDQRDRDLGASRT